MDKKTIGKAFFLLRRYSGLSQEEVMPKQRGNLSSIELGKTYPSVETVIEFCTELKLNPVHFWAFVEYLSLSNDASWVDDIQAFVKILEI